MAPTVNPQCTEVCGKGLAVRSCSKTCLGKVNPHGPWEKAVALLDDQSNRSLASSWFFDPSPCSLRSGLGLAAVSGRKAEGFQVASMNGWVNLPLLPFTKCNEIPNSKSEIPTPVAAHHHPDLKSVAHIVPALNPTDHLLERHCLCG